MKKLITLLTIVAVFTMVAGALADDKTDAKIKGLEKRLQKMEITNAKSKIKWGGDLRVEAHSITGEVDPYFDGMALQAVMANSMFFHQDTGNLPMTPTGQFDYSAVQAYLGDPDNYGAFMLYLNGLDLDSFGAGMQGMLTDMAVAMGMDPSTMTPEDWAMVQQGAMQAMIMDPNTGVAQDGFKTDNSIMYTTRLRLNMQADVSRNVDFTGRLSMYKPWGASTQTGVFNGQANTLNTDANWPGVAGDATLKVDRAYFTWKKMFGQPLYLSLGRRPSTDGPPLHYRNDELRAGTPMGTIIDMQFDGATLGWNLTDMTTIRACYGLGYESQYGNGSLDKDAALKDAHFFGFNIDGYQDETMHIQGTIARAFDITDGFNGQIIMPYDPVSGQEIPGPIVTRFTPSANLGDFDVASVILARRDGPVDWFVTGSWSKSHPEEGTFGPFGGLFSDPFQMPESQTGSMYYVGARYNFDNDKTKIGVEYNKGSEYWFNFAPSQDDIIAPKTSTRGTVWEGYLTHRITRKFVMKLAYISYDFDYTGTGWHVGAPKELGGETPALTGFPTYSKAGKFSLGFSARF